MEKEFGILFHSLNAGNVSGRRTKTAQLVLIETQILLWLKVIDNRKLKSTC